MASFRGCFCFRTRGVHLFIQKNETVNKERPTDLVINLSDSCLIKLFTLEIELSKMLHLFFTLAGGPT